MLARAYLIAVARDRWYAAGAVVLAGVLCAVCGAWVALVPIFESPDEYAHFDYAYALANAGRLLRPADGIPGYAPRVAVLARDAELSRIAFYGAEPAPADYGTPTFFERVRRDVALTPREAYDAPRPHVPLLAGTYPFLPYALDALAIAPWRDDIVSAFFVARWTHVTVSAAALLVWATVLRRCGFSCVTATIVLTVQALLPLTSFVSAYVQPDGWSALFVAITISAALCLRDLGSDKYRAVLFGVSFACLALTKLDYFVAVAIATVPLALWRLNLRRRADAAVAAIMVAPASLALVFYAWFTRDSRTSTYFSGKHSLLEALMNHVREGDAPGFMARGAWGAYVNFFAGGTTARTWWGTFGWIDAPLVIRPSWTESIIVAQTVGTAAVILLLSVRLARAAHRLIRVGQHRGMRSALRIFVHDPLLTAYIVFAVLLVALYTVSDDVFGAQGRNWFPLETAAIGSAVLYAPGAFRGALLRRRITAAFATLLLVYSVAAAPAAVSTVIHRYYHYDVRALTRPLPADPMKLRVTQGTRVWIDIVRVEGSDAFRPPVIGNAIAGSSLEIEGWAIDSAAQAPCSEVFAVVGGRIAAAARPRIDRPDVASSFGLATFLQSGFRLALPVLSPGRMRVLTACVAADGRARGTPAGAVTVDVRR